MNNKFVRIDLTYNYPEDDEEYDEGPYGTIVISLDDPSLFIAENINNGNIDDYGFEIADILGKMSGSGPYTIDDIDSNEIEERLSEIYSDDVRTADAFVSVDVKYDDLPDMSKFINPSIGYKLGDRWRSISIPYGGGIMYVNGIHPLRILNIMKKKLLLPGSTPQALLEYHQVASEGNKK